MNDNHQSGGSFNSFLLGLIIGGGAVFLLGTKRGKELVKTITEGGLELSELLSCDNEDLEIPEKKESCNQCHPKKVQRNENESTQVQSASVETSVERSEPKKQEAPNGQTLEKIVSAPKRFFRGIPKRN
ncbi:MAG: YtxH domain-containing protein [Candidatus Levyibacteriota bacterium]